MNFHWALTAQGWAGLVMATGLQVVLGVDNIVLISILSRTLPAEDRHRASKLGVAVAMVSRLLLLLALGWIAHLSHPLFSVAGYVVSYRTLLFALGGLFLVSKATSEMIKDIENPHGEQPKGKAAKSLGAVLIQIFILDVIFSLDQVMSAVALVPDTTVQVLSVVLSVVIMIFMVQRLVHFLEKHPSVRILALSFLVMVGISLLGDSVGFEFPRPMLYFAMAYASAIEALNFRMRKKRSSHDGVDGR